MKGALDPCCRRTSCAGAPGRGMERAGARARHRRGHRRSTSLRPRSRDSGDRSTHLAAEDPVASPQQKSSSRKLALGREVTPVLLRSRTSWPRTTRDRLGRRTREQTDITARRRPDDPAAGIQHFTPRRRRCAAPAPAVGRTRTAPASAARMRSMSLEDRPQVRAHRRRGRAGRRRRRPRRRSRRAGRRTAAGGVLVQAEPAGPVEVALGRGDGRSRRCAWPLSRSRPGGTPRRGRRTPPGRCPAPAAGRGWPAARRPRRGRARRAGRPARPARRPRAGTARRRPGPGRPARRTSPTCGKTCTRPSSASRIRLSRTGVRLTPSAAASSFSDSAAPGGSSRVSTLRRSVS